jgi:hypothetical protein
MREKWSLRALADAMSERSGNPTQEEVLRLGDWAMMEAFPDGAFTDRVGQPVERLAVYVAARAFALWRLRPGFDALTVWTVYVSRDALIAFRNKTGTMLPPDIDAPEQQPEGTRSSPPPCPDGQWRGALAALQFVLDTRQHRAHGRPFGRTPWGLDELWDAARADAGELVGEQPDRAAQLEALDAEWNEIQARRDGERRARQAPPPTPPAPAATAPKRRRGRQSPTHPWPVIDPEIEELLKAEPDAKNKRIVEEVRRIFPDCTADDRTIEKRAAQIKGQRRNSAGI